MFRGIAKQVGMAIKRRKRTAAKKRAIRLATRKVARPIFMGTETPRSISTSSVFSLRASTSSGGAGYRISDINGDLIWSDVTNFRPFVRLTVTNKGTYKADTIEAYNNASSYWGQGPVYSLNATLADGRTAKLYVKGSTIYFGKQGNNSEVLSVVFHNNKGMNRTINSGEEISIQVHLGELGLDAQQIVGHNLGGPLTTSKRVTGTAFTIMLE